MTHPDPYQTLGVPRDSSARQIKDAYRKAATAAHPDKGGSDEQLQAINQAWETLGDPEKRARYDETGEVSGPAAKLSPGEEMFLQVLDQQIEKLLLQGEGDLLAAVGRHLKDQEKAMIDGLRKIGNRTELVTRQLGRYISRVTVENLIESRLKSLLAALQQTEEHARARLVAIRGALGVWRGYADARPDERRSSDPDMVLHTEYFRNVFGEFRK